MRASKECINFIKEYEQLHDADLKSIGFQPKKDARGIYTIGYGHALIYNGRFVTDKTPNLQSILSAYKNITLENCITWLVFDITRIEMKVKKWLKREVRQEQFDALVSHAYNCGYSRTLYNLVNNPDSSFENLKEWFTQHYITSGGTYLKGLKYRRNDEWAMYSCSNYKRDYILNL